MRIVRTRPAASTAFEWPENSLTAKSGSFHRRCRPPVAARGALGVASLSNWVNPFWGFLKSALALPGRTRGESRPTTPDYCGGETCVLRVRIRLRFVIKLGKLILGFS